MKKYMSILFSLAVIGCMTGCERDLMDYEGTNSLYFDVQRGADWIAPGMWPRQYHTGVNFIEIKEPQTELRLKMAFAGAVTDYGRPFKVEVVKDSTTAEEGVHFTFQEDWVMPEGANMTYISIVLNKDEEYILQPKRIMLRVVANEYFDANMTFEKLNGRYEVDESEKAYNNDPRVHTIELTYEVAKPAAWTGVDNPRTDENPVPSETGLFGAFTVKKYLLMLEVTGLTDEDFNDKNAMTTVRKRVISEIMSRYLEEQFDKKKPVLEEDGRLMWFDKVTKWKSYQYEW